MSRPVREHDIPWWALVTSGLAPLLLIGGWSMADAVQPPSYSPMRQTVSVLAGHGGHDRWLMTEALAGIGLCHLATAAGLRFLSVPARLTLVVAGVAGVGIALSPEPVHGSTPRHIAFTAVGAVAIAIWPAVVGRRAWPGGGLVGIAGSAVVPAVSLALFAWLVAETRNGAELGAAERAATGLQTCWPFVVVLAARLRSRAVRMSDAEARPVHRFGKQPADRHVVAAWSRMSFPRTRRSSAPY